MYKKYVIAGRNMHGALKIEVRQIVESFVT
jgi:hypothetical protein